MRAFLLSLFLVVTAAPLFAQAGPSRPRGGQGYPGTAEGAVRQAAERLGSFRKTLERDLEVLVHLRKADVALSDAMQPSAAIQKALDHIEAAKSLVQDFYVQQGVIRIQRVLTEARRSPATADFGRLRSSLRDDALGPASRLAVRNALHLEEETLAWIEVQELIAGHLRQLSEIAGQSLRATQEER